MNDENYIFEKKELWINRYNTFTLFGNHESIPVNTLNDKVNEYCYEYLKSLVWTSHYYFQECISQEWYYPYESAPTLQDLSRYIVTNKRVHVKSDNIVSPIKEQLEFIFPKQSYCLCDELNSEGLEDFTGFTKEFSLLKRYDWECEPIFDSH